MNPYTYNNKSSITSFGSLSISGNTRPIISLVIPSIDRMAAKQLREIYEVKEHNGNKQDELSTKTELSS